MQNSNELTQLLSSLSDGDNQTLQQITPLILDELHRLAMRYMKSENAGHTLQSTALVNEAYLKLVKMDIEYQDRLHFYAIAAKQMRRILVDHARQKLSAKRGGGQHKINIEDAVVYIQGNETELIILDELMQKLEGFDDRGARMFELRVFSGLSNQEIADVEQVSLATVEREIRVVKAWLKTSIKE